MHWNWQEFAFSALRGRKPSGQDFLRNAARWKAMTQAEREAWRRRVLSVPPAVAGR